MSDWRNSPAVDHLKALKLIDIATATERERCAKIADTFAAQHNTGSGFDSQPAYSTAFKIAAAIRQSE